MTEADRWELINDIEEETLKGGAILSEWCTFLACEAQTAFAKGANLASILTATAGIETFLRSEYQAEKKIGLSNLIDQSDLDEQLRSDLHRLRRYRNRWVHVEYPWQDQDLLDHPAKYAAELEDMAIFAVRCLMRTIFSNQFV